MPKAIKKSDLPQKICCRKPFVWRKKWAKVWREGQYCSERCRTKKELATG
ncbi:MAG TPA: DUF2256 domain-containing protein [Saprospiraceae bacterium]|nr:DUF2256 domain-containing protein [Saprospiraceae bacterium]